MKEFDIKREVSSLPTTPGVYLMHNNVDEIIYVGKAINLKARVSQYFYKNENRQNRIQQMIANIRWFEVIQVESELEALILESNLIKEHRPRYNAALRDDENHPYLRIDLEEPYPKFTVTTDNERDDAFYIGPFYKSMEIEKAVDFISKYYGLRSCGKIIEKETPSGHPCMYFSMGQCMGPCSGYVQVEEYREKVEKAIGFLLSPSTQIAQIREELTAKMLQEAECLAFESAEKCRNQLVELDEIERRLDFTAKESGDNTDLFAVASNEHEAVILLYLIRGRRLSGRDIFRINRIDLREQEAAEPDVRKQNDRHILADFVCRFYQGNPYIPPKVIMTERIRNKRELEEQLTQRKGSPVQCICPRVGEDGRFVWMAKDSAEKFLL